MKIEFEDLKKMLHAATGNVKDFVMNNDEFIYDFLNNIEWAKAKEKANELIMRCAMKLPPLSSVPEGYDVWKQSKLLAQYWVKEIIKAIKEVDSNTNLTFWMAVITEIQKWDEGEKQKHWVGDEFLWKTKSKISPSEKS